MIKTNKIFQAECKDFNEIERSMVATITTGSKDRMEESVDPNGIDLKNFQKNPVVLWAHNYDQSPIGKALWVKKCFEKDVKVASGLISKMQFADTDFGKEIFKLYQGGFMKAFSIGFIPKQIVRNYQQEGYDKTKDPYMTISKSELLEYSAVPVPANAEALALAMSKGIISEKTKTMLETIDTEEDIVSEFNNEEQVVEPVEQKSIVDKSALEEFTAENKLLLEKIEALNLDNSALRLKLFNLLNENKQKPSEISVDDVLGKVRDIVSREIRRAQGKVD